MKDPSPQPNIARLLEEKLVSGAIDKSDLKDFAKSVSALQKYKIVDWCVLGQPQPDYACVRFHVEPKVVGSLIDKIIAGKLRHTIEVFPNGIPVPDFFDVKVTLGEGMPRIRG